jgi:hypothetical protein
LRPKLTEKEVNLAAGMAVAACNILTDLYQELVCHEGFTEDTEDAVKAARDACEATRAALRKISFEELNVGKAESTS